MSTKTLSSSLALLTLSACSAENTEDTSSIPSPIYNLTDSGEEEEEEERKEEDTDTVPHRKPLFPTSSTKRASCMSRCSRHHHLLQDLPTTT